MKQKIVMEVLMPCQKCKSKAMQTAAVVPGVIKVEVTDKNQLVVIGDEIDPVNLTRKLRKKLIHAKLLTVEQDKPKEPKKPEEEQKPTIITYVHCPKPTIMPYVHCPQYSCEVVCYDQNPTPCSIL